MLVFSHCCNRKRNIRTRRWEQEESATEKQKGREGEVGEGGGESEGEVENVRPSQADRYSLIVGKLKGTMELPGTPLLHAGRQLVLSYL